jgi:hypothetical protein
MTNPLRDELAITLAAWLPHEMVSIGRHSFIADAALAFIDQHYIPRAILESDEMVDRVAKGLALEEHRMGDAIGVAMQRVNQVWRDYIPQTRAVLAAIGEKP